MCNARVVPENRRRRDPTLKGLFDKMLSRDNGRTVCGDTTATICKINTPRVKNTKQEASVPHSTDVNLSAGWVSCFRAPPNVRKWFQSEPGPRKQDSHHRLDNTTADAKRMSGGEKGKKRCQGTFSGRERS